MVKIVQLLIELERNRRYLILIVSIDLKMNSFIFRSFLLTEFKANVIIFNSKLLA